MRAWWTAACACAAAAVLLSPGVVRRVASADGLLQPWAELWLGRYRLLALAVGAVCAALALACRARPDRAAALWRRARPGLARLTLALAATLLALAAAEIVLRVAETRGRLTTLVAPGAMSDDARAFVRSIADQLDARRYRGKPWDARPRDASRRVLAVGDSFVFGYGIERLADTFPARLETALRRLLRDERVAVYNGGAGGADTAGAARALAALGPRLRPHVVVYGWFPNDVEERATLEAFQRDSFLIPLVSDVGRAGSVLWRRLEPPLVAWLRGGDVPRRYEAHLRALLAEDAPSFARHRAQIEELAESARALGAQPVVVLFPLLEDLRDYPLGKEHARVAAVCARAGVPVFDLLEVFAGEDASALHASPIDHHLDAAGVARAVDAVAPWLAAIVADS